MESFPLYCQGLGYMDCGPVCLLMISEYYKIKSSINEIKLYCNATNRGVNLQELICGANKLGFQSIAVQISIEKLICDVLFPCIIHWNRNHYVVLYKILNNKFYIANPATGYVTYTRDLFLKHWINHNNQGVVILVSL